MAQWPGAGAEGPERRGHSAWQQAGAGSTMSLCPAHLPTGSGLGHSGTDKSGPGPFCFGRSFSGRWSKGGTCFPLP